MFDKIITTNTTETKSDDSHDLVVELLEEIVARLEDLEKKCNCGKQIK